MTCGKEFTQGAVFECPECKKKKIMQTKFKRHQKVRILRAPDSEYTEYEEDVENPEQIPIKEGMNGRINLILPNGQYHVEILDKKGNIIAYAPFSEDDIESAE